MSEDRLVAVHETDRFSEALVTSRRSGKLTLHWERGRIDVLRSKVAADNIAPFEKRCAQGQLDVIQGNIDAAESALQATLEEFGHLYPTNGHLFQHVLQLALALQALDLVALFLNDRYATPDLFVVAFEESANDPAINRVTADDAGHCHFAVDPRIPGKHHADYYVAHWVSSAPLWASYCASSEREPGTVAMNSGEAGVVPGLAYCGNTNDVFLVPDGYFLGTRGYTDLRKQYDAGRLGWKDKEPVAFWRGATTGVRNQQMHWQSLPRVRLSQIAQQNAAILNAGISNVTQTASEIDRREIEASGLVKERVPAEAFLRYKYQVDIDGNTNAWPGFYQKLLTGSPVLKVASAHGFRQWYYDRLRPWINYVPVASDMADLVDKIEWLIGHDDQARIIGEAGLALARSLEYERELRLSHETIRAAFRWLRCEPEMITYYGLQRSDGEVSTQPLNQPTGSGVERTGQQQVITLKRPASGGEYDVNIDLECFIHPDGLNSDQRVVISVDQQVMYEFVPRGRTNISFILSETLFTHRDTVDLSLTQLGADGTSRSATNDDRAAIVIHSLSMQKAKAPRRAPTSREHATATSPAGTANASSPTRSIIYDDDEIRVMWQSGTSDYLFITFGDMTTLAKGDRFYADNPATKLGLNCLGFMPKSQNWYPMKNMCVAIDRLQPILTRFASKVAYGGSMGGYAAIKFSDQLGVSEIIAFCPQWSIDPAECQDSRAGYRMQFRPFMSGMGIRSTDLAGRAWVLYDPADRTDSFHYDKIASLGGDIAAIHVHMVDHHVTQVLASTSILSQILDACRNSEISSFYQIIGGIRRGHRIRRRAVLRKAAGRHPILVLHALNAPGIDVRDLGLDDTLYLKIIESLIQRGKSAMAGPAVDRLSTSICPQRLRLLRQLVNDGQPAQEKPTPIPIMTAHKSALVYCVFDGRLHHSPLDHMQSPPLGQYLLAITSFGTRRIVVCHLDARYFACKVEDNGQIRLLDCDCLSGHNVITVEDYEDFFAFRVEGGYMCADRDGRVAYDRQKVQGWERFTQTDAVANAG